MKRRRLEESFEKKGKRREVIAFYVWFWFWVWIMDDMMDLNLNQKN